MPDRWCTRFERSVCVPAISKSMIVVPSRIPPLLNSKTLVSNNSGAKLLSVTLQSFSKTNMLLNSGGMSLNLAAVFMNIAALLFIIAVMFKNLDLSLFDFAALMNSTTSVSNSKAALSAGRA